MSQTRADAQGDAKVRVSGGKARNPRMRPMSPHVQVWRWHVTMANSILQRMSGVALYVGLLIVAAWAVALAGGPELYADYMGLMSSLLGRLVLFGLTLAVWYHTVGGIRHLTFDAGRGYHPRTANQTGWAVIAFTVLASVLTWLAAAQIGAL